MPPRGMVFFLPCNFLSFAAMTHPDERCNQQQVAFLASCPPEEWEFHAALFRTGNAAYRYHQLAQAHEPTEADCRPDDFTDWLAGLPASMRWKMAAKGFAQCKTMLPFTRFVNERRDIGMDAWMQEHLSEEDYRFWEEGAGQVRD